MKSCFGCKAKQVGGNKCVLSFQQGKKRSGHGDDSRLLVFPLDDCPRPTTETKLQQARFDIFGGVSLRTMRDLHREARKA